MARPEKLDLALVDGWLARHAGWARVDRAGVAAIAKSYAFGDFAAALAFTVRLGCIAERRDHHPDIELKWGSVRVVWSTHDAGGISDLDLGAAEAGDTVAG